MFFFFSIYFKLCHSFHIKQAKVEFYKKDEVILSVFRFGFQCGVCVKPRFNLL